MIRYQALCVGGCYLLLAGTSALAVEMQPSPIQGQLAAGVQAAYSTAALTAFGPDDTWADDVDQGSKPDREPAEVESGRKSIAKAAALSALVPGAGLHYLGQRRKARYFFAAEALTWLGYLSFKTYGNWKEDDYIRFANSHANAQLDGKDKEFHDLVGFYTSIDDYNSFGRIFDPERPYLQDTPDNHWRWQSLEDRDTYRTLKNRSREADRRAEFMLGVAVIDRVISVIDAIRSTRQHNKRVARDTFSQAERPYMKLKVAPFSDTQQIKLTLFTEIY